MVTVRQRPAFTTRVGKDNTFFLGSSRVFWLFSSETWGKGLILQKGYLS